MAFVVFFRQERKVNPIDSDDEDGSRLEAMWLMIDPSIYPIVPCLDVFNDMICLCLELLLKQNFICNLTFQLAISRVSWSPSRDFVDGSWWSWTHLLPRLVVCLYFLIPGLLYLTIATSLLFFSHLLKYKRTRDTSNASKWSWEEDVRVKLTTVNAINLSHRTRTSMDLLNID